MAEKSLDILALSNNDSSKIAELVPDTHIFYYVPRGKKRWRSWTMFVKKVHSRKDDKITKLYYLSIYPYTLAVSPSLEGSRQHKINNKNNGNFTPFF